MRLFVPMIAAAALAACSQSPADAPAQESGAPAVAPAAPASGSDAAGPALALAVEAEGLRLFDPASGAARPIPFGTARAQVMTALAARGAAETGTNGECGAGPLDFATWVDGLTLWFQDGALAGWALNGADSGAASRAASTAAGIAPGSTRAELEDAYAVTVSQTTLGTEFAAGELFGLIEGDGQEGRISAMWAGVSCNFR